MGINTIFTAANWGMPFKFWAGVFFVFGCIVGSFLNVVIHRLPIGQSIVSPPSHCPHCKYSIPWYLNMPLITWLVLRGKCANCGAPISIRYFLVELLTGIAFLFSWIAFGSQSAVHAIAGCVLLAGLISATFIDFEHYIIPDEITLGGIVVGLFFSLLAPTLHGTRSYSRGIIESMIGAIVGAGLVYLVLRLGKLAFGKQKVELPAASKIIFTEEALVLPDQQIRYDELFYRKSDTIHVEASTAELCDRCYRDVSVQLTPDTLVIGEEQLNPADVPYMELLAQRLWLPREAMGLGDVKFMAAIGAFLGWQAVVFSLLASSVIGAVIGITLIALGKRDASGQLPYGPYIATAAVIWMFGGQEWWQNFFAFHR